MERVVFGISKQGILKIRVVNGEHWEVEKDFSVVRNSKIDREITLEELKEYGSVRINNFYSLVYESSSSSFSVVDERTGKSVLRSKRDFVFTTGIEKGVRFEFEPDEYVFGLGQDHMANLHNRNVERRCWHQWNGYDRVGNNTIPFYLSSKGYGLFVDTSYPVRLVFGKPKVPPKVIGYELTPAPYDWDAPACENGEDTIAILVYGDGIIDLWIVLGDFNEILQGYYELTGFPRLLPKWAYGFIQCKNRYRSAEEVLHVARKMREKSIPCDCVVIDWMWFREFGDLEWDERYFPNMKDVIKEINGLGIQVMQAQHPFIERNSLKFTKFNSEGCIVKVPEGARPIFDHSHPKAKDLWWEEIRKFYLQGVRGYWTDMGEPEFDWPGAVAAIGQREKYHNVYTLLWSKNLYTAQVEEFRVRPFILARTLYLGIQNYNTALWSGDIFATWQVLRDNVVIGQNVSISGQPYFCTDIGGFHTDSRFTPELYIRWMEWGIFNGIFRTHGTKPENEPWSFGTSFEPIISGLIRQRYRLVPYIYSLSRKMSLRGGTLVRPTFLEYRDTKLLDYPYQYLFGDFLVSPVVVEGSRIKRTYLPRDVWFNYWDGRVVRGPVEVTDPAPLGKIPLYVREGSIIVESDGDELNTKDTYDSYVIKVFGLKPCEFNLYEDDGITFDYEEGKYNEIRIAVSVENSNPVLSIETLNKGYKASEDCRTFHVFWYTGNREAYSGKFEYRLGEHVKVSLGELSPVNFEDEELHVYVDNSCKRYDGTEEVAVLLQAIDSKPRKLRFVVEQPRFYFTDGKLEIPIEFSKIHEMKIIFKPHNLALPQFEDVNWRLYDESTNVIAQGSVRLGNEHLRNWKVAVSRSWDGLTSESSEYYLTRDRDNNPFGYVKLLDYVNAKYLGFIPVDFIDIKVQEGIAVAETKLLSPKEKEVLFKIKGERSIAVYLNDEKVFESEDFVVEKLVPARLKDGENTLRVRCEFSSQRPWTGREFGFSIQVLNVSGEIDSEITTCL